MVVVALGVHEEGSIVEHADPAYRIARGHGNLAVYFVAQTPELLTAIPALRRPCERRPLRIHFGCYLLGRDPRHKRKRRSKAAVPVQCFTKRRTAWTRSPTLRTMRSVRVLPH